MGDAVRLLQVCNVGSITGGTAACAWSVTRSLPDWDHEVLFLSGVNEETRQVFGPVPVRSARRVVRSDAAPFDRVLLHNTDRTRCEKLDRPTTVYRHSAVRVAAGDRVVACSQWLAKKTGDAAVLWQGVSRPVCGDVDRRPLRDELVIGRICTPRVAKWPESVIETTAAIASRVRDVRFEFVGCPEVRRSAMESAARGRVDFFEAGWNQRDRLAAWDALVYTNESVTESFGRTAAEAMRAGCIPIVDRRGGFVEQLDSGGGFLCSSMEEVVEAVARIADPFERRAVSRRAVEVANERFSLAAFRERLLSELG